MRSRTSRNSSLRPLAFAFVAGVVATVVPSFAQPTFAGAELATGRAAPAFVVERPDGSELSSKRFAGRPLLVNVFAAWCGSCRVEEPLLAWAYAKYKDRVAFLGIDEQEGSARAIAFAHELHVPYPIAIDDGQFAASYRASKIPETVLVDRRGVVRAVFRGLISSDELERSLARIAAKD